jgi:hypothetical protein
MPETNPPTLTMEFEVHFPKDGDRRRAKPSRKPVPKPDSISAPPKLPRVVRMLALAHHLDDLLQKGHFKDYADIARVAGLSRARITQIMNLLYLAPEIQESMVNNPECAAVSREKNMLLLARKILWHDPCFFYPFSKRTCWTGRLTPNQGLLIPFSHTIPV